MKWFEREKINGSLDRLSRGVGYAEIRYGVDGLKQLMSWALFHEQNNSVLPKPFLQL